MRRAALVLALTLSAAPVAAESGAAPATVSAAAEPAESGHFPSPMAVPLARMFTALFALCAAAAGLAWWSRRRRGIGPGNENRIQIIASRGIGPRHNLVLVEIGERRLLLGTGPESVASLADLTEIPPFAEELARSLPREPARDPGLVEVIGTFEGLDA